MPDPTIAALIARHLNRIISGLGSDNDAQAIAQAIAAQAERLDVLEAVVADQAKAALPNATEAAIRLGFDAADAWHCAPRDDRTREQAVADAIAAARKGGA